MSQSAARREPSAEAVYARAGGDGRGRQIHAGQRRAPRIGAEDRTADELEQIRSSRRDIATGIVRVVPLQISRRARRHAQDRVAEARGEALDLSNDGLVYVCDRVNDRLQVFTPQGKFVKEIFVAPDSLGDGSTWDVAFSRDAQQKYMFLADGRNQKLRIFDRQSLTELTNFGEGGHYPGQFYSMHSIATDSKGNLYTTETYQGRRVQRFVYKGLAPVTKKEQGAGGVWPKS